MNIVEGINGLQNSGRLQAVTWEESRVALKDSTGLVQKFRGTGAKEEIGGEKNYRLLWHCIVQHLRIREQ